MYKQIELLASKLFEEWNELLIDVERGCVKIDKPHKQYQAGILTSHFRVKKSSNLEAMLETPKWVANNSRRKALGSAQKRRQELAKNSSKKMKIYPDSKDIIREETREEG